MTMLVFLLTTALFTGQLEASLKVLDTLSFVLTQSLGKLFKDTHCPKNPRVLVMPRSDTGQMSKMARTGSGSKSAGDNQIWAVSTQKCIAL